MCFLKPKIDHHGIHPIGPTWDAITRVEVPSNVIELRSFIGMVNHYCRIIKQLSTKLRPLHNILCSDMQWHWDKQQSDAFSNISKIISSPPIVVNFDPSQTLVLTTDASEYGIGVVLSQTTTDDKHQIVCYSRTITKAECNYSQLDKEGLAVIFGIGKSHKYVYGRHVKIITDQKPLITLFVEHKHIPVIISPRIQRWAITLSSYNYSIEYKPGKYIPESDCLSRLPLNDTPKEDVPIPGDTVLFFEQLDTTPVTSRKIVLMTKRDHTLSKVLEMKKRGIFPLKSKDEELKSYVLRQTELSTHII